MSQYDEVNFDLDKVERWHKNKDGKEILSHAEFDELIRLARIGLSARPSLLLCVRALEYIADTNRQSGPIYDTDPERARATLSQLKREGNYPGEET